MSNAASFDGQGSAWRRHMVVPQVAEPVTWIAEPQRS